MKTPHPRSPRTVCALTTPPWMRTVLSLALLGAGLALLPVARGLAADAHGAEPHAPPTPPAAKAGPASQNAAGAHGAASAAHGAAPTSEAASKPAPLIDLKAAIRANMGPNTNLTLVNKDKEGGVAKPTPDAAHAAPTTAHTAPAATHGTTPAVARPVVTVTRKPAAASHSTAAKPSTASRNELKAKAAAMAEHAGGDGHGGEVHWSYEGEGGPRNWGQLKPEFTTCGIGKRQSPINIVPMDTLQGPAEPLQFDYNASGGSVVNNGHTIQVDMEGTNLLTVRGTVYRLVQFHFHTPSEEQINHRHAAMVAHLVHKSADGQLAVVAVLLEPGLPNPVIEKVWTYMPLDVNDRVRLPPEIIDLNELLPKDQRYYQFMGSLTTPPCTEGVLWNVLKQPVTLSREQIRLFQQLYPSNNRPVQPTNGRPVREAK